MKCPIRLTMVTLVLAVSSLSAATHYVSLGSTNPQPPYATWATAATNIQDAVDASNAGDTVLVTNGVYNVGQRNEGQGPTRVVITNATALQSINGPEFTVVNGGGGVRCAYLADGASLSGFTLTNGTTSSWFRGGGVSGSSTTFVTNCVISGNSGGGAYSCTLYNCTVIGNNSALGDGGGAWGSTLYNCMLTGNNSAHGDGGGAWGCTLYNCTLTGNSAAADTYGGGASASILYYCTLSGNSALEGGGAWSSKLYNCTLTGNSATGSGGGAGLYCKLYNCIVYSNTAPVGANYYSDPSVVLNYCCATPLPTNGVGNIALDPQLASLSHLSTGSPCRGAGSPAYATGTDIDGEAWSNPPSIGCDEYHAGAVTGSLTVNLLANYTNVAVGGPVSFTALIEGRTTDSVWDFGDGDVALNQPYVTRRWTQPGDYLVALWAFNESNLGGVSATLTVHVLAQPVSYAAVTSTNPQPPYASWATAATNLQEAVDAAIAGGTVLVSNGVYATGGRAVSGLMTRVDVDKPLTVRSVNGPQLTVINGGGSNGCVYVSDGASVSGFTLTNALVFPPPFPAAAEAVVCAGSGVVSNCVITGNVGGGALGGTLYNCTLTGNSGDGGANGCTLYNCTLSANQGGGAVGCTLYDCTLTGNSVVENGWAVGGGAYYCTLYNCTLTSNSVTGVSLYGFGGGAYQSTLYNCTLTGNSAVGSGGGAYISTLFNCIVYSNTASVDANYDASCILNYCCTIPIPTSGVGNITNAPLFVDYAHGKLHLQSNSPCINAGNNAYVTTATDLDGNPRIVSGTVDIGAYEYQGAGSLISYAWLQQYGLPTDGSADYADPDHDGLNDWQEWVSGTNPTNALSALRMVSAVPTPTNAAVTWQSVAGVNYFLERSADLAAPFTLLATNIVGQASNTSYTDPSGTGSGPFFYRVGVRSP